MIAVAAAAMIALFGNVLAARHYRRWDWTSDHKYTLSDATLVTLHELREPVDVWLLSGGSEPLLQPMRALLTAYAAETPKLVTHVVDPDRDRAAFDELRRRFKIEAGRTAEGRVVADAVVIVASGERHWFIAPQDLVEVQSPGKEAPSDVRVRPRQEQALTLALRQVTVGEKARVCFTEGHGELLVSDMGERGLGRLRDVLEKDNFEVAGVDTTAPGAAAPFAGCSVVVVAGPRGAFAAGEARTLLAFVEGGGNLLAALGPVPGPRGGWVELGLDGVLSAVGVALREGAVVEIDRTRALPDTRGMAFYGEVHEHAVARGLAGDAELGVPRVAVHTARPLRRLPIDRATVVEVLTSSARAFAATRLEGLPFEDEGDFPVPQPGDERGPLAVVLASERSPQPGADPALQAESGRPGRAVVMGSASLLEARAFDEPLPTRGAALLVEGALSWLAARPIVLDVPARPTVAAGLRVSEASRAEVARYVLLYMPIAVALIALAVGLRRRSTEGLARRPTTRRPTAPRGGGS
jgi:hypothetical protein